MGIFLDEYHEPRLWWGIPALIVGGLLAIGLFFTAVAYILVMPIDRYSCHRYQSQTHQQVKYDIPGITCYVKTDRGWIDRDSLYVNKND